MKQVLLLRRVDAMPAALTRRVSVLYSMDTTCVRWCNMHRQRGYIQHKEGIFDAGWQPTFMIGADHHRQQLVHVEGSCSDKQRVGVAQHCHVYTAIHNVYNLPWSSASMNSSETLAMTWTLFTVTTMISCWSPLQRALHHQWQEQDSNQQLHRQALVLRPLHCQAAPICDGGSPRKS